MILIWLVLIFLGALVFVSTSFFDFLWLLAEIIIAGVITVIVAVAIVALIFGLIMG